MFEMRKLTLFFVIIMSIFWSCVQNERVRTEKPVLNQPVKVFLEYNTKKVQPKLKLVFDNTSDKDYTINQDISLCIEIDSKSLQGDSWKNIENWIESENAISGENWGISDENGNLERYSIDGIYDYKLIIPAKSKVTKYIIYNYVDVLREDNFDTRIRFKYDTIFKIDTCGVGSVKTEKIANPIVSEYFHIK